MMTKEKGSLFRGKQIRVLIISDRLMEQARELAEYFRGTENIEAAGIAENRCQVLELAREASFDYLIIAGYLKAEHTYGAIQELQKQGKEFLAVHWAILDPLISVFCRRYKIPLQFERTRPMGEFVKFLESHLSDFQNTPVH